MYQALLTTSWRYVSYVYSTVFVCWDGCAAPVATGSALRTSMHKADDPIPVHRRSKRPREITQMLTRSHVHPRGVGSLLVKYTRVITLVIRNM
jgi:hypothetical protein